MFDWFDEPRLHLWTTRLVPVLFNQWKHIHVLFKFNSIVFPFHSLTFMFKLATIRYLVNFYPVKSGIL